MTKIRDNALNNQRQNLAKRYEDEEDLGLIQNNQLATWTT